MRRSPTLPRPAAFFRNRECHATLGGGRASGGSVPREVLAMKLGKPFDVRAYGIFRCALVLTFTLAVVHGVSAATPAALTAVSGGGQVATVGGAFPQTLSARVTDASGAPVAGVDV